MLCEIKHDIALKVFLFQSNLVLHLQFFKDQVHDQIHQVINFDHTTGIWIVLGPPFVESIPSLFRDS